LNESLGIFEFINKEKAGFYSTLQLEIIV
jgi:hypothetical protein